MDTTASSYPSQGLLVSGLDTVLTWLAYPFALTMVLAFLFDLAIGAWGGLRVLFDYSMMESFYGLLGTAHYCAYLSFRILMGLLIPGLLSVRFEEQVTWGLGGVTLASPLPLLFMKEVPSWVTWSQFAFCVIVVLTGFRALAAAKASAAKVESPRVGRVQAPISPRHEDSHAQSEESTLTNQAVQPRKTLSNLIGMADLKQRLLQAGKEALSGIHGAQGRNGILLHGEPGNGKTVMAEALAGSLKLPFLSVSFSNVGSRWVNQTTEQVVEVFRDAAKQAPCVLFIDEIDSLLRDRGGMQGDAESNKTANALLTELVSIRGKGVLVMAATNYLDALDGAGIREGRFDYKIEIPHPDQAARVAILHGSLKKAIGAGRLNRNTPLDMAVLEQVCARWEGFSAARIHAIGQMVPDVMEAGTTQIDARLLRSALRAVQGIAAQPDLKAFESMFFEAGTASQLSKLAGMIREAESVEALGGKLPRAVLFYGPPGTGKTKSAVSLAKAAGCAFIETMGSKLMENPEEIDRVLKQASALRPCIVFIDEADTVFGIRNNGAAMNAVTNKLLAAIDGASASISDVMFVAATNYRERFDDAAIRGGRFSTQILFELPSSVTRERMTAAWVAAQKLPVAQDLIDQIPDAMMGNSHADIASYLRDTVNAAIVRISHQGEPRMILFEDLFQVYEDRREVVDAADFDE